MSVPLITAERSSDTFRPITLTVVLDSQYQLDIFRGIMWIAQQESYKADTCSMASKMCAEVTKAESDK